LVVEVVVGSVVDATGAIVVEVDSYRDFRPATPPLGRVADRLSGATGGDPLAPRTATPIPTSTASNADALIHRL
jgi:hypothetical protein